MRITPYNYDMLYKILHQDVKLEHPNESEEWYKKEIEKIIPSRIQDIFKSNIFFRFKQDGYNDVRADYWATKIINILPKELYPNIEEWIDEKPLSDIKYCGISIKDIMNHYLPQRIIPFNRSIEAMLAFIESGSRDINICYNYCSMR